MASFSALNLSETMVSSLGKMGYKSPSKVQLSVIPRILKGESLLCQSPTGSGKTHAYLIPIIEKLDLDLEKLQCLVICPSRELARQVYEFAREFLPHYGKLRVRLFSPESDRTRNQEGLSKPPHILIGTPGRLKDVLADGYALDLRNVSTLVLDEADMLMEYGYFDDIDAVYSLFSRPPQTLVFSATLEEGLKQRLSRYIQSDFLYEGGKQKTAGEVKHHLLDIKHMGYSEALNRFLKIRNPYLCIVFASTKKLARETYGYLKENNFDAVLFSGDLSDRERKAVLRRIKENRYQIIVSSDLLSRGIDILDVSEVVSLDLPNDPDYYFHRAGRSGRFGKTGDSWVFYNLDYVKKPKELMEKGVEFDFYTLGKEEITPDPVGLAEKKKFTRKKAFEGEERKEIKILKAKNAKNKKKPAYKKKLGWEVEKVKDKYRRKKSQKGNRRGK